MPSPLAPFKSMTMETLVICNYLREHPVPYTELARYAGHKETSLRVAATTLRRSGRLSSSNVVDRTHPSNANLQPLPDLPDTGWKRAALRDTQREEAAAVVATVLGEAATKRLTMDQLIKLTDTFILTGAAGKEFLNAVRARIDLEGIAPPALGPPPPTTRSATIQRLHDLIVELPDDILAEAVSQRLLTLAARAGSPPSSPPPPPEPSPEAGCSGPDRPLDPPGGPEPDPRSPAPNPGP